MAPAKVKAQGRCQERAGRWKQATAKEQQTLFVLVIVLSFSSGELTQCDALAGLLNCVQPVSITQLKALTRGQRSLDQSCVIELYACRLPLPMATSRPQI